MSDELTAYLVAARAHAVEEQRFVLPDSGRWSCEDVPRLAGALEAVLALAGEWDLEAGRTGRLAERRTAPADIMLSARAQALADSATALREAITAELLGEG